MCVCVCVCVYVWVCVCVGSEDGVLFFFLSWGCDDALNEVERDFEFVLPGRKYVSF